MRRIARAQSKSHVKITFFPLAQHTSFLISLDLMKGIILAKLNIIWLPYSRRVRALNFISKTRAVIAVERGVNEAQCTQPRGTLSICEYIPHTTDTTRLVFRENCYLILRQQNQCLHLCSYSVGKIIFFYVSTTGACRRLISKR